MARDNKVVADINRDLIQLLIDYIPGKDGSLTLKPDQIINLKSDVQYEFDNITIPFAAHLRVKSWDPLKHRGGRLIIHCFRTIHIQKGGSIDLSKSGYYGGRSALCAGGSYDHYGPNTQCINSQSGGGGGGMAAGGASYGTSGDNGTLNKRKPDRIVSNNENIWNDTLPQNDIVMPNDTIMDVGYAGSIYGDARISQLYLGSGGGSSFWSGGGRGGGALLLITNNLINEGQINCCGGDASESGSGGGSGGSILIDVLGENRCVFGKIRANGGFGNLLQGSRKSYGGDGGNGRICINNKALMMQQDNTLLLSTVYPKPHITWAMRTDGHKYRL